MNQFILTGPANSPAPYSGGGLIADTGRIVLYSPVGALTFFKGRDAYHLIYCWPGPPSPSVPPKIGFPFK